MRETISPGGYGNFFSSTVRLRHALKGSGNRLRHVKEFGSALSLKLRVGMLVAEFITSRPVRALLLLYFLLTSHMIALAVPIRAIVYPVVVEIETRSDWTHVLIQGLIVSSYELVRGSNAPGLRVEVRDGEIRVGKRQYDTTLVIVRVYGYLVFTAEKVEVRVEKGDLEYTTIRVYGVRDNVRELVWDFTNSGVVPGSGGLNPRCSEISKRLFERFRGRIVIVRGRRTPKLVLAFYYPWYGNPQGPSHRWFHWNTPPGVSYEEIAAATDYPLLGPYDSWDERVVRSHIEMAKAAGIDGFICSWWGIGTFEDLAFERMLNVAEEEGFNLTIYYETVRDMNAEQMVRELSYIIERYARHPAFLKLDGRPVIFIYAVEAMDRDLKFWRRVLERVEVETGVKPIYVGDTCSISFLEVFEGLHTYNPIWIENHEEMYSYMSEAVKSYVPLTSDEAYRRISAPR